MGGKKHGPAKDVTREMRVALVIVLRGPGKATFEAPKSPKNGEKLRLQNSPPRSRLKPELLGSTLSTTKE